MFRRKPKRLTEEEYLAKLIARGVDPETGHPKEDATPIAPPVGYRRQPSMFELMREMVRGERVAEAARQAGKETFEESEDFDCGDEDGELLTSGFENDFDPPLADVAKIVSAERDERKRKIDDEEYRKSRREFYRRSAPPPGVSSAPKAEERPQEPPKAP